jgi:structural hemagglutinin/hemolysin toxin protein RtxA
MYKICFYVPTSHAEQVKDSLFTIGAGKVGEYSCCAWQVLGEGQFMPLEKSNAFLGEKNKLEKVPEYKVEMVCADELIHHAIAALKQSHPYEEPAYHVFRIEDF